MLKILNRLSPPNGVVFLNRLAANWRSTRGGGGMDTAEFKRTQFRAKEFPISDPTFFNNFPADIGNPSNTLP